MINNTLQIDGAFLGDIGERVATTGLGALTTAELADLLRAGCHAEVATPVLTVLADDNAPEVVRVRALGRVLVTLDRREPTGTLAAPACDYVLVPPVALPVEQSALTA